MKVRFGWPTMILLGAVGGLVAVGGVLYTRNAARSNQVALAASAKKVATIAAVAHPFQATRRYVGTVEPWIEAKVGPQLVSAYVQTVLVRPGTFVKRGQVLATLDCRNSSAMSKQVSAEAVAADAMSTAAAKDEARYANLAPGNYVSEADLDLKKADAARKKAQLAAIQAQMASTALQVDDCVLKSAFDGEIANRFIDPGAFVRPGSAIVTVVDRHLVRITVDVPEGDFGAVEPERPVRVHLLAVTCDPDRAKSKCDLVAKISRRAPSADPATRTVHVEIDVDDPDRIIPVWTTAELSLDVDEPVPATAIPLNAASVHGTKATIFVANGDEAKLEVVKVIGERGGALFLDPKALAAGTKVVTEGRTVLSNKDAIATTDEKWQPDEEPAAK